MKALVLHEPGPPAALRIADRPVPGPGPNEVRVRVRAFGLNPADYKVAARGLPAWTYPHIPGLDAAGTIDATGSDVTGWQTGDAVFFHVSMNKQGVYAEYAIADARTLAAVPEGVAFTQAAALPCAGYTAYQAVHRKMRVRPDESIFVQAGAGGVGGYAIQLARLHGLETIITTCSANNADYARKLGATHVIDYNVENIRDRIMAITGGRGVDAALESISRPSSTAALDLLAYAGQLAFIAGPPDYTQLKTFTRVPSVHEVALGAVFDFGDAKALAELAEMGRILGELVRESKLDPMVTEVVSMAEVPHALQRLAERHVRGKIVCELD